MAFWSRPHIFKAAFLLSVLLLILLNFSNFRSNNPIRTTHPITTNGLQWPMPLHPEHRITEAGSEKRSATNRNASQHHNLFNDHNTINATNQIQTNNLNLNLTKPFPSTIIESEDDHELAEHEDEHELDIQTLNESLPIALNLPLATTKSGASENVRLMTTTQAAFSSPFLSKLITKFKFVLSVCPLTPPNLIGPIDIDTEYESMSSVEKKFRNLLLPGGWYKPHECNPKDRVAIVIPYRDRADHLPIFLKNIHALLMKQQIEYGIFVVEQVSDGQFNRAALMNVGFLEALKLHPWDCFIFHDVDLIPMDDRNLYRCPEQPRHMSVAVDTMGYKLPYSGIFGGVSAMTVKQFRTVNGFSNSFWGWGGEDDDMSNRLKHVGYHIARYPINIARYKMLSHRKEKANPKRYEKLVTGVKKFDTEGLNSLKYDVRAFERRVLYTWILAEVKQDTLHWFPFLHN